MRRPALTAISLLLLWPSLATTAPPTALCGQESSLPAWRRLSDAIVRTIWGAPEIQPTLSSSNPVPALVGGTPTTKLLARYGEDLVLRFKVSTAAEASALAEAVDVLFLDVWESNEDWVDIRIAKNVVPSLLNLLPQSLQNAHVPLMQNLDLAQAILDSYPSPSSTSHNDRFFSPSLKSSSHSENIFFQDYQPLSVIIPWMNLMASMFTTHVRRINIGISYEGRDIPALRVGVHPTNGDKPSKPRKTILITGGSHAREWVSVSTVNYVAWSLITSYGKDHSVTRLLEDFDFVFVPTLNPDGYVYSWETDRLWRKNRQPTSLRFCRGIDLDRSYSYQWDGANVQANPCSESYAGDAPFDAIESRRFAEWAKNETEQNNVNFVALLDLHSYSQQILYPYSYSCSAAPPTEEDLEELAMGLSKAIRTAHNVKGHYYQVSSACKGNVAVSKKEQIVLPRIEPTGGSALDWFYHELKVQYPYQIKLRDTGSYGFLLPRENIVPTGKEMLDALLYLGRFLGGEVGFATEMEESADVELKGGEEEVMVEEVEKEHDEEEYDSAFELRRRKR